jgi:glutamate 5-kinase
MKLRSELTKKSKILIVKLSSLAVTNESGGINKSQLKKITKDIEIIRDKLKLRVVLVSSGAINAGVLQLIKPKEERISYYQACSSVGQPLLMNAFDKVFSRLGISIAQVLVTHEDLKNKKRSHNLKSTLNELLNNNIIPILNENDSVSFDEITVGDNDQLSAMICELLGADTLLMLTKSDGLYTKDPNEPGSEKINYIAYNKKLKQIETKTKSSVGRGGMKTKLEAVRKLTPLGVNVIISSYLFKNPVLRSLTLKVGTLFEASPDKKNKKLSWILPRVKSNTTIVIDKGARDALCANASLLAVGIKSVSGVFGRGDSVSIVYRENVVAFGIVEYSNKDIDKIKGLLSSQLGVVLTHIPSKVVIHKDNLILNLEK